MASSLASGGLPCWRRIRRLTKISPSGPRSIGNGLQASLVQSKISPGESAAVDRITVAQGPRCLGVNIAGATSTIRIRPSTGVALGTGSQEISTSPNGAPPGTTKSTWLPDHSTTKSRLGFGEPRSWPGRGAAVAGRRATVAAGTESVSLASEGYGSGALETALTTESKA